MICHVRSEALRLIEPSYTNAHPESGEGYGWSSAKTTIYPRTLYDSRRRNAALQR
jgi:hypothetical protein